ncbi:D-tagatose-bisphosphate aldolase, class II, non-catalytic subunit [Halovulum sp. GXIMD14793]
MTQNYLANLVTSHDQGRPIGITSVCSAHPQVLTATLAHGKDHEGPVLIEATCNQVNQDGGYTGIRPQQFRDRVGQIAAQEGCENERIILGGDHLGPNPWRHLPAAEAMKKAEVMIAEFAAAGFTKIHLDCSMACADDPSPLTETVIAGRAAELAAIAESAKGEHDLYYVIGTEVPPPGGATEYVEALEPTNPDMAAETLRLHQVAFASQGLDAAFDRVIGLVVQPGVEFGHENVAIYQPEAARDLIAARRQMGLVYEAHSTDYQSPEALGQLVKDGFAILKVGPWLTFALREALYGLDAIHRELTGQSVLQEGMDRLMTTKPAHWSSHYEGTNQEIRLQRHFSYSDRIRYYWAMPEAQSLVETMIKGLSRHQIPETLISQHLPIAWADVACGALDPKPNVLMRAYLTNVLNIYARAAKAN